MPYSHIIIRHLVVVKLYEKGFDSALMQGDKNEKFNPKDNITKSRLL